MQKKSFYFGLIIAISLFLISSISVAIISGSSLWKENNSNQGYMETENFVSFRITSALPENPTYMTIYKTIDPLFSTDDINRLLGIFNLNGEVSDLGRNLVIYDEGRELEIFKQPGTGFIRFSNYDNVDLTKKANNLPTDEEAIKMADEFLKSNNFLPENAYFKSIDYHRFKDINRFGVTTDQGKSAIQVGYGFTIDGFKAIGAGAKAGVVFGDNGELIMFYRYWRDLEPYQNVEIVSPEEAIEFFKDEWIKRTSNYENNGLSIDVEIDDIYIAYLTEQSIEPQGFIEPVYVFSGIANLKDMKDGKVIEDLKNTDKNFEILVSAVGKN